MPSTSAPRVDLPDPLAPTTTTVSPGSMTRSATASTGVARPGRSTPTARSATGTHVRSGTSTVRHWPTRGAPGTSAQSVSPVGRSPTTASTSLSAASPSVLSWNSALARRSGTNTSGATIRTPKAADRCTDPSRRRMPSGTATSATDTDANVSRTRPERNANRRLRRLAARSASLARSIRARWVLARPNARSTGRPRNTSATWRPRVSSWCQRRLARPMLVRPTSAPNRGNRTMAHPRTIPDSQSMAPAAAANATGATTASVPGAGARPAAPGTTIEDRSKRRSRARVAAAPMRATNSPPRATAPRSTTAAASQVSSPTTSTSRVRAIAPASRCASTTACQTTVPVDTSPRSTEATTVTPTTGTSRTRRRPGASPRELARPAGGCPSTTLSSGRHRPARSSQAATAATGRPGAEPATGPACSRPAQHRSDAHGAIVAGRTDQALPEHPVGPALVGEHEGGEDGRHDRHHRQRVVEGGCRPDEQPAVGAGVGRRQDGREHAGEDGADPDHDACAGGHECPPVAPDAREHDGNGDGDHGRQADGQRHPAGQLARHGRATGHDEPGDEPADQRGRAGSRHSSRCPGTRHQVAVGLERQEQRSVEHEEGQAGQSTEDGDGVHRTEEAAAVALGRKRHTVGEVGECRSPDDGRHEVAREIGDVPRPAPTRACELVPELGRHTAHDEGEEDQEQHEVETAEQRCVPAREGGEGGAAGHDQPHLVAIPHWADGIEADAPVGVVAAD